MSSRERRGERGKAEGIPLSYSLSDSFLKGRSSRGEGGEEKEENRGVGVPMLPRKEDLAGIEQKKEERKKKKDGSRWLVLRKNEGQAEGSALYALGRRRRRKKGEDSDPQHYLFPKEKEQPGVKKKKKKEKGRSYPLSPIRLPKEDGTKKGKGRKKRGVQDVAFHSRP